MSDAELEVLVAVAALILSGLGLAYLRERWDDLR